MSTIVAERLGLNIDAFIRTGDAAPMVNTATFFSSIAKDASFQHENELRLVYAPSVIPPPPGTVGEPHVIGDIKVLRWRASSYGVTPYFEFAFNTEAISEIWIGPANPEHKDYAARHLIATMLHLNCLWNVRLLESRSPYR